MSETKDICMECMTEVIDGVNGWVRHYPEEGHTEACCNKCDSMAESDYQTYTFNNYVFYERALDELDNIMAAYWDDKEKAGYIVTYSEVRIMLSDLPF